VVDLANMKMAAVVPKAMFTGLKMMMNVAKLRKRANKAAKIFEKTLRKEGFPPERAASLARIYRHAVPIPDSFSSMIKH